MSHFEDIVLEFLRADRSIFINSQCCIQLNPGDNPDTSGPHWYCDAVAVNFRKKVIYLCEITYASPPSSLMKRLAAWNKDWPLLCKALIRDSGVPSDWLAIPWLFVPEKLKPTVNAFLDKLPRSSMPSPIITALEEILPWQYRSWNRVTEDIPLELKKRCEASMVIDGVLSNSFLYDLVDIEGTEEQRAEYRKKLIEIGLTEDEARSIS